MKKIILILIVFSFASCFANSVFSFKGLAQKFYMIDIYGQGMGETGVSDLFRVNSSYNNPSLAATTDNVIFSSAVSLDVIKYKSEDATIKDDGFYLPYFNFVVPVKKHRFGFNFTSLSTSNLVVNSETTVDVLDESFTYSKKDTVETAIYNANLIYAHRNKIVNFGVSVDFYLGNHIKKQGIEFDNNDLNNSIYRIENTYKNVGYSIGLSKKMGNLSLGLSYNSRVKMETNSKLKYQISAINSGFISKDTEDQEFTIPETWNAGATFRFLPTIKSSFDVHFENWTGEFFNNDVQTSYKAAVGLAYDPIWGYGKWYEQFPLRVGYYYRKLPFKANNENVIENAATLGLSVPLVSTQKYLEIALKYMVRGNVTDNLMQDNTFEISIGFSGFDVFQKKQKRIEHRDIPIAD